MSAICVFTPVVIAAWPAISAAAIGVMSALGYAKMKQKESKKREKRTTVSVDMELRNSQAITDELGRGEHLAFQKEDISLIFYRDARGACGLKVCAENRTEEELRKIGSEIGERIVQQYIYDRLRKELKEHDFIVVEEGVTEDSSIRLRVRRWQE